MSSYQFEIQNLPGVSLFFQTKITFLEPSCQCECDVDESHILIFDGVSDQIIITPYHYDDSIFVVITKDVIDHVLCIIRDEPLQNHPIYEDFVEAFVRKI